MVFGCSNVSEEGHELVSATKNGAGKRGTEQQEKRTAMLHRSWFGLCPMLGSESLSLGHCGSASLGCSGDGCSRVDRVNV